jgi:hypothetical protein
VPLRFSVLHSDELGIGVGGLEVVDFMVKKLELFCDRESLSYLCVRVILETPSNEGVLVDGGLGAGRRVAATRATTDQTGASADVKHRTKLLKIGAQFG